MVCMENKDWTGNGNSVWKALGASNHTDEERERNDYRTVPYAWFVWEKGYKGETIVRRI